MYQRALIDKQLINKKGKKGKVEDIERDANPCDHMKNTPTYRYLKIIN